MMLFPKGLSGGYCINFYMIPFCLLSYLFCLFSTGDKDLHSYFYSVMFKKLSKNEKTSPILRLVKTPTAAIPRCPALVCGIFTGNFSHYNETR